MTTAQQGTSGGGIFSKLVLLALLAVTIGLYLRVVMFDAPPAQSPAAPQASVQVVEARVSDVPAAPVELRDLPADQMQLIIQVFAPELQQN